MSLQIVVSGARNCRERDVVKSVFDFFATKYDTEFDLYQCEDHSTCYTQEGKQAEIDGRIRRCDWFILLATTNTYGEFTRHECEVLRDDMARNSRDRILMVLRPTNVDESVRGELQSPDNDRSACPWSDIKALLDPDNVNFEYDYKYLAGEADPFANLRQRLEAQVENLLTRESQIINKHAIRRSALTPDAVYSNHFRTLGENGFDEAVYVRRSSVDDLIEMPEGNFIVLLGAPASGKSRAVYEYLKRLDDDARIVTVTPQNLDSLAADFENFDKWSKNVAASDRLRNFYFVCDQITDIVSTNSRIAKFLRIYDIVMGQGGKILATSLNENYSNLAQNPEWSKNVSDYTIEINKLSKETDSAFIEAFERTFEVSLSSFAQREVIGEFIKGLTDYNNSVMSSIISYDKKSSLKFETFVKAFSVIAIFRHINNVPLGLVLAVYEKIARTELTDSCLSTFVDFCAENNILAVDSDSLLGELCIERGRYEYDDEMLTLPVSTEHSIRITNDYIWQQLYARFAFDLMVEDQMKLAFVGFFKAFFADNQLATLHRAVTRSPSMRMSLYQKAHTNFVWDEVYKVFRKLSADPKTDYWDVENPEMCQLAANLLNRSANLDVFKSTFAEIVSLSKGRFSLSENVAAEIFGFCDRRNRTVWPQLKEFLKTEHGYDVDSFEYVSFYVHSRLINFLETFDEVAKYVEQRVLIPEVLEHQADAATHPERVELNRQILVNAIIHKCACPKDVVRLLEMMLAQGWTFSRRMFKCLINTITGNNFRQTVTANRKLLEILDRHFDNPANYCEIPRELIDYYLVIAANSFQNALSQYERCQDRLKNNSALKMRMVSAMIGCYRPDEFGFLHRHFFQDGKVKDGVCLPQISRNKILKNIYFGTSIALVNRLFDGSSPDATPDVNTVVSLLRVNITLLKRRRMKLSDEKYAFQNLLMVMSLPFVANIEFNNIVISNIFQCCATKQHEAHAIDAFIKPNIRRAISRRQPGLTDRQLDDKVEAEWNRLRVNHPVVLARIRNSARPDFAEKIDLLKEAIDSHFRIYGDITINPQMINATMQVLFNEFRSGRLTRPDFDSCRTSLKNYLNDRFNGKRRIDYFFKDPYFYSAYFRLYPEEAVTLDPATGKHILSNAFFDIPVSTSSDKIVDNTLIGICWILDEATFDEVCTWVLNRNSTTFGRKDYILVNKARQQRFGQPLQFVLKSEYDGSDSDTPGDSDDQADRPTFVEDKADSWKVLQDFFGQWHDEQKRIDFENAQHPTRPVYNKVDMPMHTIDQVRKIKEQYPDSVPNFKLMCDLLKSRAINPFLLLDLLETIYLKSDISVGTSLWHPAIDGINGYFKRDWRYWDGAKFEVGRRIARLRQQYPGKIIENTTIKVSQLGMLDYEVQKAEILQLANSGNFLTEVDLSKMIVLKNIWYQREDILVDLMSRYVDLLQAIYGDHRITDTYTHFLISLPTAYCTNSGIVTDKAKQLPKEAKRAIIRILDRLYDNYDSLSFATRRELRKAAHPGFYNMLVDLYTSCGYNTIHLLHLIGK